MRAINRLSTVTVCIGLIKACIVLLSPPQTRSSQRTLQPASNSTPRIKKENGVETTAVFLCVFVAPRQTPSQRSLRTPERARQELLSCFFRSGLLWSCGLFRGCCFLRGCCLLWSCGLLRGCCFFRGCFLWCWCFLGHVNSSLRNAFVKPPAVATGLNQQVVHNEKNWDHQP